MTKLKAKSLADPAVNIKTKPRNAKTGISDGYRFLRLRVEQLLDELTEKNVAPMRFQTAYLTAPPRAVAFFSMEYMLRRFPFTPVDANVAGDQLKAASDLGVPVVAIGSSINRAISARTSMREVIRPADANEVKETRKVILHLQDEPAALVLTRQAVLTIDRTKYASASRLARGACVLAIRRRSAGGYPHRHWKRGFTLSRSL